VRSVQPPAVLPPRARTCCKCAGGCCALNRVNACERARSRVALPPAPHVLSGCGIRAMQSCCYCAPAPAAGVLLREQPRLENRGRVRARAACGPRLYLLCPDAPARDLQMCAGARKLQVLCGMPVTCSSHRAAFARCVRCASCAGAMLCAACERARVRPAAVRSGAEHTGAVRHD
jgi:hypothetical protein